MTTLVTALAESGYVERIGDPADKRVTLVALTEAGSAYLYERRDAGRRLIGMLIAKLPPEETETLVAAVPALLHLIDLDHEQRDPGAAVR